MTCFKSNQTLYDCDAAVLLIVYSYLVFVGNGWLAQVPSHLPHLRRLCLGGCHKVRNEYVEELIDAVPELKVSRSISFVEPCLFRFRPSLFYSFDTGL
jgi:hypothetical protein